MDEMNEQTQNKPINETAMDAVKQRYMPKKKSGLNPHNKAVASLLAVLVLAIGLAVGVSIVQRQQSTEDRAGADTAPDVNVLLNSAKTQLAAGETADIDVSIDPSSNKKRITAADFKFKLVDGSGNPSNAATITNIVINTTTGKLKEELLKTGLNTNEARLAVGAQCTEVESVATCDLLEGDAALLTATVTVKANQTIQSGTLKLNVSGTEVAALDAENNNAAINTNVASGTLPEKSFALTGDGGPTSGSCRADIVHSDTPTTVGTKDNRVNLTDFTFLVSNFNPNADCSGAACRADIVHSDTPTTVGTKDNRVNLTDFTFLVSNFNPNADCTN
jgi:hypothetical protein